MSETYTNFLHQFELQIRTLSHTKLKYLNKRLRAVTKERYVSGRAPETEIIEHGFTEEELQQFMAVVDDETDRACFILMATLGLRPGELLQLKGLHIVDDEILIDSTKGSFKSKLKLPESIRALIPDKKEDEYLFDRTGPQLRRRFRNYRIKAGLENVYMHTKGCGHHSTRNRRFTLSLNSFRHYAIQKIYNQTKDPDLTRKFARHREFDTTLNYLRKKGKDEIESVLNKMYSKQKMLTLK